MPIIIFVGKINRLSQNTIQSDSLTGRKTPTQTQTQTSEQLGSWYPFNVFGLLDY